MPTYEYVCRVCGEQLEAVQSFSDDALTVCPNCGGELRKVFGNVGIVFKGSGFYKTDSRSTAGATKNGGTDAKVTAESSGEPAPSSTDKSDGGSTPTTSDSGTTTTSDSGASGTPSSPATPAASSA